MTSIDERIVRMKFDNAQFQQAVGTTISTLDKLNGKLKLEGATKGFSDVTAASQKMSLKNVENGVQSIADKFKNLSVVGVTALATITQKAIATGTQLVKSLTTEPVMGGFREYETNMNSIQTIMANTGLEGKKGLATVNKALDELNHYSDQTIYNFSEMAKNIGTFTAAGVKLDTATAAIKGIANLAAVSGSNSEQASAAMYQLSQALAAGKVTLEDWNSVVNAGMGGKIFQDALVQTAESHGKNIKQMIKDQGSFRLTLQEGWLDSKVLTETLAKFTGDLNAKQLKAMGYTEKQVKGILKMGKTAQDAATKVKTMTQLIDTLKEGVGSGWTKTWQTLFGDFGEAKSTFTAVSIELGKLVDASSDSRNKLLGDWKKLGGRTVLIEGISNAFKALKSVIKPISDAFRQIFPATTAKQLYDLTVVFRDFTKHLILGSETADKVRRTFAGVFAIFGIGWEIIKQVAKTLFGLFQTASEGSGGILKTTASVGDFLVALHKAVKEGSGLTKFFQRIGQVLAIPIKLIKELAQQLGRLFKDVDVKGPTEAVDGMTSKLKPLEMIANVVATAWHNVVKIVQSVWLTIKSIGSKIAGFFGQFGSGIAAALKDLDFGDVMAGINTGLIAGIFLTLKNAIGGGAGGGFADLLDNLNDSFEALTGALKGVQHTLQAAALLQIAIAVGILAISMNTLAKIDSQGLTRASAAISVMFAQLIGSLVVFQKFVSSAGFAKMPFVMGSLILLASAVVVLASAVKMLADLSWKELSKGIVGVLVLIDGLVFALKFMPAKSGLISSSVGLVILAGAIKILVTAVKDMQNMDWKELAKGMSGIATLLLALGLYTKFAKVDATGVLSGAGIILLAAGLKLLVTVVKDFADMSWADMAKGLVGVAVGLDLVGAALVVIPPTAPLSAAGVLIVALSLKKIGEAVQYMGNMSWKEIAKGIVTLAASMAIIAASMIFMTSALPGAAALLLVSFALGRIAEAMQYMGNMSWKEIAKSVVLLASSLTLIALAMILMLPALPGAAALLVVSAALAVLAPVLQSFGDMSWVEIAKGLAMLAGVFAVLGISGLLLIPVVPVLLALGVAINLLGAGMLLAGVGVLAFSVALATLAAVGVAGTAAIVGIVGGLAGLIPVIMKQIGLGIIAFAEVIGTGGPAFVKATETLLNSILEAISRLTPKILSTLGKLVLDMLNVMLKYTPDFVDRGLKIVIAIFNGITKNMGKLTDAAAKMIVAFLDGVSRNLPKIIQAGFDLIIKFIDGVAKAIDGNSERLGRAGGNLGVAIIQGMVKGIAGGIGAVAGAAERAAKSALNAAKSILDINSPSKEFEKIGKYVIEGFVKGLDGNAGQINTAFNNLKNMLSAMVKSSAQDIKDLTAKLKKLTSARKKDVKAINATKAALAEARKEHKFASSAYSELTKRLGDEKDMLNALAGDYDRVTARIKKAQETLANAIKTRDDYNKQIKSQYSDLPSATGEATLASYLDDLKKQVEDTKVFSNAIQRLRKLGLNDEMYQDLLATGTSALPFVAELLAGGKSKVDEINKLGKELDEAGAALGKTASTNLYQAAVNSAKGIVVGLQKEQAAIEKQMDKIADSVLKSIAKKLGITLKTLPKASNSAAKVVRASSSAVKSTTALARTMASSGNASVNTVTKTIGGLSDAISGIDSTPTITPVLDLTEFNKSASQMGSLLSTQTITPDAGYSSASAASAGYASNQIVTSSGDIPLSSSPLTFNQFNNSPKALSSAEIYRQTRNQLSVAKGALATSAG